MGHSEWQLATRLHSAASAPPTLHLFAYFWISKDFDGVRHGTDHYSTNTAVLFTNLYKKRALLYSGSAVTGRKLSQLPVLYLHSSRLCDVILQRQGFFLRSIDALPEQCLRSLDLFTLATIDQGFVKMTEQKPENISSIPIDGFSNLRITSIWTFLMSVSYILFPDSRG